MREAAMEAFHQTDYGGCSEESGKVQDKDKQGVRTRRSSLCVPEALGQEKYKVTKRHQKGSMGGPGHHHRDGRCQRLGGHARRSVEVRQGASPRSNHGRRGGIWASS